MAEADSVNPNGAKYTEEEVYKVLEAVEGNVAAAARELETKRGKLKEFIDSKPALVALLTDLREEIVDIAEGNIFRAVKDKADLGMSMQVVSTLGKNRGWTNRQELTGKDDKDLVPTAIVFQTYDDDEDSPSN